MQPGPRTRASRIRTSAIALATVAAMASPLAAAHGAVATAVGTTTLHVDAGGGSATTEGGISWRADGGYSGGTVSRYAAVSGSLAPAVYGSIRYGMSAYDLTVADGRYDVTLRMVEPWHYSSGKRVFDVAVEGRQVLDNFDVYSAAGGRMKAVNRTVQVDVTGGRLDIDFAASVGHAIVSAISVVPATATTTTTTSTTTSTSTSTSTTVAAGYPFGSASLWRQSVTRAPLHSNSADIVRHLHRSVTSRYGGVATFNAAKYNSTYYVVGSSTPRTTVKYSDCQGKGNTYGLYDGDKHFVSVPIPSGAVPAAGTDGAMSIYSPSTNQLWEFWKAEKRWDGWYACWGGRMDSVSTNIGHFRGNYGTTATGLPHAAGQISLADVRSGRIGHAVALLLAEPRHRSSLSWPAQRSDGWVYNEDAVPHGLRLRLDPTVNVDALDLHPVAKMVAKAAQTYGFVAVDSSGATGVYAESGLPEKRRTGVDPWGKLLGGTPQYEVMENFPWHRLQALPVHYGRP